MKTKTKIIVLAICFAICLFSILNYFYQPKETSENIIPIMVADNLTPTQAFAAADMIDALQRANPNVHYVVITQKEARNLK